MSLLGENGRPDRPCLKLEALALAEAAGESLSSVDRSFAADHLAGCDACRLQYRALSRLDYGEGHADAPRDEFSRRRLIEQVLARHQTEASSMAAAAVERPRTSKGHWVALAAAAAILVVVGALVVLRVMAPGDLSRGDPAGLAEAITATDGPQVAMVSGEAFVGAQPLTVGQDIGTRSVRVERGALALRLSPDVSVLLRRHSRARVRRQQEQLALELVQGEVLATVREDRGARFAILVGRTRVEVTGTIFAVRAVAETVDVSVFRGSVRVRSAGGAPVDVTAGQTLAVGAAASSRDIAPGRRHDALERAAALALLSGEETAVVSLQTTPAGAQVTVDGRPLGRTPLKVRLANGNHRLRLRRPGYAPIEERLNLAADQAVERDFALSRIETEAQGSPQRRAAADPRVRDTEPGVVEDDNGSVEAVRLRARRTRRGQRQPRTARPRPAEHPRPAAPPPRAAPRPAPAQPAPVREPVASEPGPEVLLARAQQLRAQRRWAEAAAIYRELIGRFPASVADPARISLGFIELDHLGQPARALGRFDRYLARHPRDGLAQEAAFGRLRALRALGRGEQERRALERFLRLFPSAVQVPQVKRRLEQLSKEAGPRP